MGREQDRGWWTGAMVVLLLAGCGDVGDPRALASEKPDSAEAWPRLVATVETDPSPPASCLPRTDAYVRSSSPNEDSYVSQSEPTLNFGASTELRVDGSPRLESYLKFSPYTEGLAIRAARLEFTAIDGTSDGPRLYRTGDDWTETGLTWNNRPSLLGGVLGNLGAISANSRVSYDVTGVVTQGKDYSFVVVPDSSDGVGFYSRESTQADSFPRLVVTTESPPFCTYRGSGTGGRTAWARQIGGAGAESVETVAPHPQGGFVAAGRFGDAVFTQDEGFALARYDAEGAFQWSRVVVTDDVSVTDLTVTSLGNILVVGRYHNAPNLGTGPLPSAPETQSWMSGLFIAKFSPGGTLVWAHGFVARDAEGVLQRVNARAVATDAHGSLLVTGDFAGRMDLGGGPIDSGSTSSFGNAQNTGGFVAKFTWEGQHLWSRALSTHQVGQYVEGRTVSTDAADHVLLGGSASAVTDLGDGPLGEDGWLGEPVPFLAKYTPSGVLLWKRVFRGAAGEVRSIQPQGTDRIAFGVNIAGTFTFAGQSYEGEFMERLSAHGFLGAMTAAGGDAWLRSVGSPVSLDEFAVGRDGSFVLSGTGYEAFDAGGGSLGFAWGSPFVPTNRPFVARYTAEGAHLWSRSFDQGRSIDLAPLTDGGVVLGTSLRRSLSLDGRTFTPVGNSDLLYLKLRP